MPLALRKIKDAVAEFRSALRPDARLLPLANACAARRWGAAGFFAGAIGGFLWFHSPAQASYLACRDAAVRLTVGGATWLSLDVRALINDGLLCLFFFSLALGARRQWGAPGSLRAEGAAPLLAWAGGLAALVLVLGSLAGGWGFRIAFIAAAVDLGLALAAFQSSGGVPGSARHPVFGFSAAGDAGLVIAVLVFGARSFSAGGLVVAAALAALLVLGRRVLSRHAGASLLAGAAFWSAWSAGGLAPALAGAALAFLIPTRVENERSVAEAAEAALDDYDRAMEDEDPDRRSAVAHRLSAVAAAGEPPIDRWQRRALALNAWLVLPLFGWANAGGAWPSRAAWGLSLAILAVKPAGVFGGAWFGARWRPAERADGGGNRMWAALASVACAGGPAWVAGAVCVLPDGPARAGLITAFLVLSLAGTAAAALALRLGELDGPRASV